jgi:beta-lactamase class A
MFFPRAEAFAQNTVTQDSPARADVEKLIEQGGGNVSVAFRSLDGKQQLLIQADKQFPAAGPTIKIPVMIELYAEAQAGYLKLTDALPVHNDFKSIVDGSEYQLDPKGDPDPDVYKSIGSTMTLRDLCDHMVTRNSDLAADLLIEKLGAEQIRERLQTLHIDGIDFRRGFESTPSAKGPNNSTSARGLMELLWTLANGDAVTSDVSKEMIGIIAHSASGDSAPASAAANAPADSGDSSRTAHLTTDITGVHHEETIVYGARSFVVVIVMPDLATPEESSALMAQITHSLAAGLQ